MSQQLQQQQVIILQQHANCSSLMRRPAALHGKQRNLEISSSSQNSYSFHQELLPSSSVSTKNNTIEQSHIAPGRKYSFDALNIPSIGTKISLSNQNKKQRVFQQPPPLQLYDIPESSKIDSDSSSWVNSLGDQYCLTGQSPSQASSNQLLSFQSNHSHTRYSSMPSPSASPNISISNQPTMSGQFSSAYQNYFEANSPAQANSFSGLSQERLTANPMVVNSSQTHLPTQPYSSAYNYGYQKLRKVPKIRCSAQYGNGQWSANENHAPPSAPLIQGENSIGTLYAPSSSESDYSLKSKGSSSLHESPTYQQHGAHFKPIQHFPQNVNLPSNNQTIQQSQQYQQSQQNQVSSQNFKEHPQQQQYHSINPQEVQLSQQQYKQIPQLKPSPEQSVQQIFCAPLYSDNSNEQFNSQKTQVKPQQELSIQTNQTRQYYPAPDTRRLENNQSNIQQNHLTSHLQQTPFAQLTNSNTVDQSKCAQFMQQQHSKQQLVLQYQQQNQLNQPSQTLNPIENNSNNNSNSSRNNLPQQQHQPQMILQVRQQNQQCPIVRREQISHQQQQEPTRCAEQQYNYRTNSNYCKSSVTTKKGMSDMTAFLANRQKPPLKKNQEKVNENILFANYNKKEQDSIQGAPGHSYQGAHNILKQDIVVSLGAKGKENINLHSQEKKALLISRKDSTKVRAEGKQAQDTHDLKEDRSFSLDATKISKAMDTTFNYSDLLQLSLSELEESSQSQILEDTSSQNVNKQCQQEQEKLNIQEIIEVRKRNAPETFTFNTYVSQQSQHSSKNNNSWECDKEQQQQQQSSLKGDSQGSESTNDQQCEIIKQSEKQQDFTGDDADISRNLKNDENFTENDEEVIDEEYANSLYQQLTIERSLFQMKTCLTRLMSQIQHILPPNDGEDLLKFQLKLKNILALRLSLEELKMIFVTDKCNSDLISKEEVLDVLLGSQSLAIINESQELAPDTKKIIRNVLRETRRAEIHLRELRQKFKYCQDEIFKVIAGEKQSISCSDLGTFFKSNGFDVRDQEMMMLIYRFHRPSTIRLAQINFRI